ncbi:MAG: SDR family oxidoreductase [Alphaproteobacteria bacterium]|nr:SDR family oxidoreductase [Hoeflea sp.]MBU4530889.1 SDR family oxidoreductase [Alphaproteobacteria bacterium]MBU4542340.1 SDR family oxidoreductase [Alphaproteobacteria bacterium]MBU4551104.1 SDR family oxidoreductase [Alphaproteobacteria bacterium]MBV1785062.1 SDR family oxidoreductase [Hoeflea sp.]
MVGRLDGKSAIVSGAGQGIGRAIAIAFAREGATVVAISRSLAKMEDLPGISPGIRPLALDVASLGAEAVFLTLDADILVNCAGYVAVGTTLTATDEDWRRSFEINVLAPARACRAVLPGMIARGAGSIVNVASVASSVTGVKDRAAYGATKAALIGLSKAIARDHISEGVRCNVLCPGTTQSPSLDERILATEDPEATRRAFIARQPMGRLGLPDEMAEAVVFLASDAAAFMTGSVLVVDGGQTL